MKTNIFIFLIVCLIIGLATYSMMLIYMDSIWFERATWLQTASSILRFLIPSFLVLVFFRRHFRKLAYFLILVILLCLVYGLYYKGFNQMISDYPLLCFGYVISTIVLVAMIYAQKTRLINVKTG